MSPRCSPRWPMLVPRLDERILDLFVEELFRWNPQLGLVSKRDTPAVVARLVEQSVRCGILCARPRRPRREPFSATSSTSDPGPGSPGWCGSMLDPALSGRARRAQGAESRLSRTGDRTNGERAGRRHRGGPSRLRPAARSNGLLRSRRHDRGDGSLRTSRHPSKRFSESPGISASFAAGNRRITGDRLGNTAFHRTAARETPDGRFLLYERLRR